MSCNRTMRMFDDLLNKTLSVNEERQIKRHLEECASCRNEYHKLANADHALRQVICEMVADIDVPPGLCKGIEKAIFAAKRNTLRSRLSILLATPAVAAALLFVVLAAGFGAYSHYFDPVKLQRVAISDKDIGGDNEGAMPRAADNTGNPAQENAGVLEGIRVEQADQTGDTNQQMEKGHEDTVMAPVITLKEPGHAGATGLEGSSDPQPGMGQESARVMLAAPGAGGGMDTDGDEGLETLPKRDDFIPVRPDYLPPGAVLVNISGFAGEVTQDYRAGANYFKVSQSRQAEDAAAFAKKQAAVSNISINGCRGYIEEVSRESDDVSGTVTTLSWQQGGWAFSVSGDLPAEEIIKISASLNKL